MLPLWIKFIIGLYVLTAFFWFVNGLFITSWMEKHFNECMWQRNIRLPWYTYVLSVLVVLSLFSFVPFCFYFISLL